MEVSLDSTKIEAPGIQLTHWNIDQNTPFLFVLFVMKKAFPNFEMTGDLCENQDASISMRKGNNKPGVSWNRSMAGLLIVTKPV